MGSIGMISDVTTNYCMLGNSISSDVIHASTVSIIGSSLKVAEIIADTVTISSPVKYDSNASDVYLIGAKYLTVTADNENLLVNNVEATERIAINGGTYGESLDNMFGFSGSTSSTITAGVFNGEFQFIGSAELRITGGFFNGIQRLEAGKTTINGTYSSTTGWNLEFLNLFISTDDTATCEINSGYFKAASADQMKNISSHIVQTNQSVSATKFVELVYTNDVIGSGIITVLSMNADKVKKAVVDFQGEPRVRSSQLYISYPEDNVELRGKLLLDSTSYHIVSVDRKLNPKGSSRSIVWTPGSSGENIPTESASSPYYYNYPTT
jgi:hypothetical protein